MSDPIVARFKLQGRDSLWRYPRVPKWEGWHFAADDEGCNSLLALFDLMEHAQYPSRVTLPLTRPPNEVLNVPNREVDVARPAVSWTLGFNTQWEPGLWELSADPRVVSLRFGVSALPDLRKGVRDSLMGNGDYAIGGAESSEYIWIWWWIRGG
jgi:hypothetical protein